MPWLCRIICCKPSGLAYFQNHMIVTSSMLTLSSYMFLKARYVH